jgi:hypothetical protein
VCTGSLYTEKFEHAHKSDFQYKWFSKPGTACGDQSRRDLDLVPCATGSSANTAADQDKLERERFAQKYKEMHRLVREPDGFTVLYIGAENWPFPISLIFSGKWRFDSDSGAQEVLAREVGENESAAIEVCHTIGSVQDGNTSASDNPVVKFARNVSQSEGAERSGELFHGYYFRVLKRNARDAVVVAYPAEYRSSGVMTFVVSKNAAYERDLGPQTAAIAQKLQGKPSGKWSRVE